MMTRADGGYSYDSWACQQTFPRQTTAADAPIAENARMLAAAVAPRTALLINRILNAPIVPRCKQLTGKSDAWFLRLGNLHKL